MLGLGLGLSVVPIQICAFSGVDEAESGLAAGLINTAQEIGGALMVAVLATIAFSHLHSYLHSHPITSPAAAGAITATGLTGGFHVALVVAACLVAVALVVTLTLLTPRPEHPTASHHHLVRPFAPRAIHEHRWSHAGKSA
jgi:hypothetical protein